MKAVSVLSESFGHPAFPFQGGTPPGIATPQIPRSTSAAKNALGSRAWDSGVACNPKEPMSGHSACQSQLPSYHILFHDSSATVWPTGSAFEFCRDTHAKDAATCSNSVGKAAKSATSRPVDDETLKTSLAAWRLGFVCCY